MAKNQGAAETTRNYPLYVLLTLRRHSDRNKPLSVSEVCDKLNETYAGGRAMMHTVDRSTVSRILLDMETFGEEFPVKAVMSKKKGAIAFYEPYEPSDIGKSKKKYYYYEQEFSEEQILTIRDAVEAYNYLAVEDITGIIDHLVAMCPDTYKIERYGNQDDRSIKDPGPRAKVLNNIRNLNEIIKVGGFAQITYCNYGIDGRLHKREGYPKIFKPLKLLWGNGFYYCACIKDDLDTPVSLRLDRITMIKRCDVDHRDASKYKAPKDVIPSKSMYRLQHPVMFGGEVLRVRMLVRVSEKNGMTNALIDIFGRNIRMGEVSEEELKKVFSEAPAKLDDDEKWIGASVQGSLGGMVLFATQYCQNVRIISPESVVEETRKRLGEAMKLY